MKFFLNYGGNPNAVDTLMRQTPVHYAAKNESTSAPEMLRILLEHGGNRHVVDVKNKTPLHYASANNLNLAQKMLDLLNEL